MMIVAVTACPTGIAHTYMAQEAIEKECKKRGFEVQVETQGSMGIENELDQDTIDKADIIILAVAIGIDGEERFDKKMESNRVLQVNPSQVLRNPANIIDEALNLLGNREV